MSEVNRIGYEETFLPNPPSSQRQALEVFDAAPPVEPESMLGVWCGAEVPTGHRLDGLLAASGWWGKEFVDSETVHPLVFRRNGAFWAMNPQWVPMSVALKIPVPRSAGPLIRAGVTVLRPALATRRPRARLRTVALRGVSTAAMVYDQLPIIDVFRKIDDDTVIGAMDVRGTPQLYFFALKRRTDIPRAI